MRIIKIHRCINEGLPFAKKNFEWGKWTLSKDDGGPGIYLCPETGLTYYTLEAANRVLASFKEGWRLPTRFECMKFTLPALFRRGHLDAPGYPPGNGDVALYWTGSHNSSGNTMVLQVKNRETGKDIFPVEPFGKMCLVWPVRDLRFTKKYKPAIEYR